MSEMVIRPFVSFGPIEFDMDRDQVDQILGRALGNDPASQKTWWYDEIGLGIDFDKDGRTEFVQSFEPSVPVLDGMKLLGRYDNVVVMLLECGYACRRVASTGITAIVGVGTSLFQFGSGEFPQNIDKVNAWRVGYSEGYGIYKEYFH